MHHKIFDSEYTSRVSKSKSYRVPTCANPKNHNLFFGLLFGASGWFHQGNLSHTSLRTLRATEWNLRLLLSWWINLSNTKMIKNEVNYTSLLHDTRKYHLRDPEWTRFGILAKRGYDNYKNHPTPDFKSFLNIPLPIHNLGKGQLKEPSFSISMNMSQHSNVLPWKLHDGESPWGKNPKSMIQGHLINVAAFRGIPHPDEVVRNPPTSDRESHAVWSWVCQDLLSKPTPNYMKCHEIALYRSAVAIWPWWWITSFIDQTNIDTKQAEIGLTCGVNLHAPLV